jgi:hypothetical protein
MSEGERGRGRPGEGENGRGELCFGGADLRDFFVELSARIIYKLHEEPRRLHEDPRRLYANK